MQYEIIPIRADGSAEDTKFYAYILKSSMDFQGDVYRPMVILCPGGGYEMTSDREAEPIAMRLLSMGYHVGCLLYTSQISMRVRKKRKRSINEQSSSRNVRRS